ncbi:pentatricopeptide repeat protein [Aspergillus homomorphus CBS 101889]|uniref:Pentatricopeptide repeat protein n=1 Tax=Aspergillus homomorphus (strain CBS 101889) TaxID=1450537 RepID=A0A395HNZ0_ASPHC|nr:hypothetical protein BO97DRAFT_352117 [Aspergillus homomorphus CBS 101889]RAL09326.1 hypothetical protein BO97DRAFT_352117 [Aspergillus homomorphus CBS 101889]
MPTKAPKQLKLLDPCEPGRSYRSLRLPHYGPGNRPLRHNAFVVNGGTISYRERIIDEEAYNADQEIRKSSLFVGNNRLRRWRTARNELFKSAYFKRPVPERVGDILEEFEVTELDKKLLEMLENGRLEEFRDAWERLDRFNKSEHWMRLSLWLLQNSPDLSLKFLYITCEGEHRPLQVMVSECLLFVRMHGSDFLHSWRYGSKTFADLVAVCLNPHYWPIVLAPQKGIRFFIIAADDEHVIQAWTLAHERQVHISAETYLAWVTRFTQMGKVDLALEALDHVRQIGQVGLEMTSEVVKRHACVLLLRDTVEDGPSGRNFHILPKLLEMGMRPDVDMMDLILRNCYKTGDAELGRDMLRHMQSQGYPLTSYTYTTLLSDATRRLDRREINRLRTEIDAEREDIRNNRFVKTKLFHAYFCLDVKGGASQRSLEMDNKQVFRHLLNLYNSLFDITPLKQLGVVPHSYQLDSDQAGKTSPDAIPLYLMIASYLRCNRHASVTARVYDRFIERLHAEDPVFLPLARTDHTWHEFMYAWRNDVRGLRPSVRLVETMQQMSNEDTVSPDKPWFRPKPTVYIWTTLVHAFFWNKEPRAAEQVVGLMEKLKVQHNPVVWTTLIEGYAQNKDILKVAETIRAMEDAGHDMDAFTIKALRHIQNPERLWQAVEELEKQADEGINKAVSESVTAKMRFDDAEDDADWLLDKGLQRLKAKSQARDKTLSFVD